MKRLLLLLLLLPTCLMSAQDLWCPEPTNRFVNDYSSMLSEEQRETLERRLVAFDDSTSNQILVIITPSLHGCEIMELGTRIGTTWGVGQKDLKNGVLILIKSKTEEEPYGDVALLPGYGLEGALPDAFCKHIIDDQMISPLSEGDYYKAISQALDVIEPVCRGEYSYDQYRQEDRRALFIMLGVMLLLVVICFVLGARYNKKHPHDFDKDDFTGGSSSGDSSRSRRGGIYWGGIPGGFGGGGFGGSSGGFGGSSGGFGGFGGGSFGGGGAHGRF